VSDGFLEAFRAAREDFYGSCPELFRQHIHPEDYSQFRFDLTAACLDPRGRYEAVYRVRARENGLYRWVSGKGRVKRQEDGSYILYAYFSDVHDETQSRREAAEEKQRQKILLTDILSTTKTAIFWKDADRRFLGANKAFLDYYGFTDESEILGKNDEEMGWHTDPDSYKNDEARVLRDGISTDRVPGKCLARGENRDIVASKSPLIENGEIVGLVGSFEDVTKETTRQAEIKRLNEALEKRISDWDLLMSVTDVCVVKIDLRDFAIVEYNDAMCNMIGLTREEYEKRYHGSMALFYTGKYFVELDKLKKLIINAMKEGKSKIALDMRVPSAKGELWIGGAVMFTDPDPNTGRPIYARAVYRDITDIIQAREKIEQAEREKRKAAALKTQSRQMSRLIDSVPSGLGALRVIDGVPEPKTRINRFFVERIDIAVDKENGADMAAFLDAVHPDDRERFVDEYQEFLKDKDLMTRQYRFRAVGGEYVWLSVRANMTRVSARTEIAYFNYSNITEMKIIESRLRESQRFYREVTQAAKLATWDYDCINHIIIMSDDAHTQKARGIMGMPHIIRNVPASLVENIRAEDQSDFLRMYSEVEAGRGASCEVWYKPMNGREARCERVTYIAVTDADGAPDHAIGFSQNITAERKVEERYQRELGYLRQSDESDLIAKGHYNLTRDKVLEYTTKYENVYMARPGISYDEALQGFICMPYEKSERDEIADKLNRNRLIERYQRGQMQTTLTYRRAREGKTPIWVQMNIHTYMMPETGDLECFTYAYDISGKMEIDYIMGMISDEEFDFIGLIYADTGEFEFVKKSSTITCAAVRERVQYSKVCEDTCGNFVKEEERAGYDAAMSLDRILEGLEVNNGHYTATFQLFEDERILCEQMDYAWLDRTGRIILVVRTDVTASFEKDQKQLARIEAAKLEADRANEAKSTFLSGMSHDLRTPLNGVIGFTELAIKEADPEKKQDYLRKINSSGRLLLDLVNETLELSRIESGKVTLEPEIVMPDNLIPAVVTALRPSADLKGIRFITNFPIDPSVPVWCDRLKVQKIALNLISNAIKYTPEGGTVSVSLIPAKDHAEIGSYTLLVEDTGIGMSKEFMERMFEPFAQEKRSESLKTPGTGLGLAIVKRYVDLMGGLIQVESRIHNGTRWAVTLPVHEAPDQETRKLEPEVAAKALNGKRVLLCEDNYMNTEIAVMLLKDKGVSVETAENGEEGVKLFMASEEGYYNAILMDLRMPVMDGNTAAKTIRNLHREDALTIPIIAMTADAFEESVREAKEVGMNGYVTKPIEPAKLFAALEGRGE